MSECANPWGVLTHAGVDPSRMSQDGPRRGGPPLVYMTYNRMGAWIDPADQALIEANPPPGKRKVTFRGPGWECAELGCRVIALDDGHLCSRHAKYRARYAERSAAMTRNIQAGFEASRRAAEAARRSREILDESADALEQLGIRPDTVTVSRSGAIEMPSETFADLLRRAVEQAEMEAL